MGTPSSTLLILGALAVAGAACTVDAPVYVDDDDGADQVDAGADGPITGAHVQVDPPMIDVGEGSQVVVRVRLSEQPLADTTVAVQPIDGARLAAAPTSLVFTPGNWNLERVVTLLSRSDDDAADDRIAVVFDGGGVVADGSTMVAITDDDVLRMVVTPDGALGVGEAQSAPVHVRLSARPLGPVTIAVAASPPGGMSFAPATVTIQPAMWNVDQAITVTGTDDVDVADDAVRLTLDPDLNGLETHAVDVTVIDDDVLNILATPGNLGAVVEGSAPRSLSVRLTQQPPGPVTVNLAAAPAGKVTLDDTSLGFDASNWSTPQIVMVAAPHDVDHADEDVTITLSATGLTSRTVTAIIDDDDEQAIQATPGQVTGLIEGQGANVSVRLAYQPSAPVVIDVSSLDPTRVGVTPATLTFSPGQYATPQVVRVTALHDADLAGGTAVVRLHLAAEGVTRDVSVGYTDDDTQAIVTSAPSVAVAEGGSAMVGVHLAFEPAGPVTVMVTSSDAGSIGAAPVSLTFGVADYATDQPVTVSGLEDDDVDDEAGAVTLATAGAASVMVSVSVGDNDPP